MLTQRIGSPDGESGIIDELSTPSTSNAIAFIFVRS
jgi:hypothetical protein